MPVRLLTFTLLTATLAWPQQSSVTMDQFAEKAYAALPVEEPYAFHKALSEWHEPLRRDSSAHLRADEIEVGGSGWKLFIRSDSGVVLKTAAAEFSNDLRRSMQTSIDVDEQGSISNWQALGKGIIAGTRDQISGCGPALKGAKDYRIAVNGEHVLVCGFDEPGVMYGLYNIEARMNLREAPFLSAKLDTTRHSLYRARMTLSGLGWEEWPDRYLALLAKYGFDSIFASVYENPNGVNGPPPYWDHMKKQNPAGIHDLVRRAGRYGIKLYCPLVYRYTGEPDNIAGLRKLVRDNVTEFPEIRGYILLTEGFYYNNWFGAGGQGNTDLHNWLQNWAKAVAIVAEECHKLNPDIEVLPWEYNIDFRPSQVEIKKYVTAQLPVNTIPLLTFENGKGFTLDGEHGSLRDYSISQVGPAEVTEAQIQVARARHMRGVYAKADTWATWQFGTFPYLPFPYQWFERYKALEKYRIDGTMESWSYGFKPNFIAEMRNWYCWSDAPPIDELLRAFAHRDFGAGSESLVLAAWKHFSQAIRSVPDTGPTMGTNNAVAAPLFYRQPKPRTMTFIHSWNDQDYWSRTSRVEPYWPYVTREFILRPDFTNQVNAAEHYAKPFTLPVFTKNLIIAADETEKGLETYRMAALQAPPSKRTHAFREVLLAEQLERMMRSDAAILKFEDMRFRLSRTSDSKEAISLLDQMTQLASEELKRTVNSLQTARRDSRLGYEWEEDYIYTPTIIENKIKLLHKTLDEEIPETRKHLLQKSR